MKEDSIITVFGIEHKPIFSTEDYCTFEILGNLVIYERLKEYNFSYNSGYKLTLANKQELEKFLEKHFAEEFKKFLPYESEIKKYLLLQEII